MLHLQWLKKDNTGVPHGSISGPSLFNIFMNLLFYAMMMLYFLYNVNTEDVMQDLIDGVKNFVTRCFINISF